MLELDTNRSLCPGCLPKPGPLQSRMDGAALGSAGAEEAVCGVSGCNGSLGGSSRAVLLQHTSLPRTVCAGMGWGKSLGHAGWVSSGNFTGPGGACSEPG